MDQGPGTRHFADANLDQAWSALRLCCIQGDSEAFGRIRAIRGNPKGLGQELEIRIVQLDGEFAAEISSLNALHIAEAAVCENHRAEVEIVFRGGRQFLQAPAKAPVTNDRDGPLAGCAGRYSQRGRKAIAQSPLIAWRDESPRPMDRICDVRKISDLGQFADKYRVIGDVRAQYRNEVRLRLDGGHLPIFPRFDFCNILRAGISR